MTNRVFVDTVAWLALINIDDNLHSQANLVKQDLKRQRSQLITTDFILLEVADALTAPTIRQKTITFINRLKSLEGLQIIAISQSLFDQGWQLYSSRPDKDWGLTDCISFIVMQQAKISVAFTCDRHFEQAGFTCLLTL